MELNKATEIDEEVIGPGSLDQEQVDPPSMLESVGEYHFVTVLNPLSITFIGRAALTTNVSVDMPISQNHQNAPGLTKNENDIRQVYGFDLRAQAQQSGKTHIITNIPIASGQTVNLMGREAKVVVGQLVTALLQREGKKQLVANKHERRAAEDRIVRRIGNTQDLLGDAPLSVQEQLKSALEQLDDNPLKNVTQTKGEQDEFPGLNQPSTTPAGTDTGQGDQGQHATDPSGKRGQGRSKASTDA